jgi:uncharacterized protein (TIGR02246 family)
MDPLAVRAQALCMPARTPEEIHSLLAAAFTAGDIDAFLELYEDGATVHIPPDSRPATGKAAIREALVEHFALRPRFESVVVGKVQGDGLAMTHARWSFAASDDDGMPVEMGGRGTIVSRRQADGSWRVVLDNPVSPE